MDELISKLVSSYGWSVETFEVWKESGFRCTYCGLNLLGSLDAYKIGQIDHILPRFRYTNLITEPTNLTLSCQVCNNLKGRQDPNRTDPLLPEDYRGKVASDVRTKLITRAKRYVQTQRIKKTRKLLNMNELIMNVNGG